MDQPSPAPFAAAVIVASLTIDPDADLEAITTVLAEAAADLPAAARVLHVPNPEGFGPDTFVGWVHLVWKPAPGLSTETEIVTAAMKVWEEHGRSAGVREVGVLPVAPKLWPAVEATALHTADTAGVPAEMFPPRSV
ncbi:hypothetical protein AB0I28_32285 [Phytomonospora sp. NPDC050363]|uniref:hypothetical protein n=1 Tax=Phytomonospora sp. NPDC050363 TaxID=3155642 RepID=UPI0033E831EC